MTCRVTETKNSSQIQKVVYFEEERLLAVKFNSGDSYLYSNVSKEIHESLVSAESVGKQFASAIRNNRDIPYVRLGTLIEYLKKEGMVGG